MSPIVLFSVIGAAILLALVLKKRDREILPSSEPRGGVGRKKAIRGRARSLLSSYRLEQRETGFFGEWAEGEVDGCRVAFWGCESRISVYAGGFDPDEEQITELYLGAVSETRPLPRRQSERLDRLVDAAGKRLATRYFLQAGPGRDYPALRIPAVRDGLLGLSTSVVEVMIFESHGVQLELDTANATRASLETDVVQAVTIAQALRESAVAIS